MLRPFVSPLDEELQLLPGSLSPYLHEAIVRLGTWMPFERVPAQLAFFTHATVSSETARRLTEGAGAALVTIETQEVERLERELPEAPEGPAVQQLSVDGAMVPLVHAEWAEVKTLAVSTVGQRVTTEGEEVPKTTDLRSCSRLTPAEQVGRLATIATHAAGTTRAETVCAVVDGADWLQGFIDLHRPGTRLRVSVRILDFPHAAEHPTKAAQAVWGVGAAEATTWLDQQLHELTHGDPDQVLAALAPLPASTTEAQATRDDVLAYFMKRRSQIAYAEFRAAGYPIGDGIVESANKLVVEYRLKGSGMHWARRNVNPMVALRAGAGTDEWERIWPTISAHLRDQEREHRHIRRGEHRTARQPAAPPAPEPPPPPAPPSDPPLPREKQVVNGRPTNDHPWRRFRLPGSIDFCSGAKP